MPIATDPAPVARPSEGHQVAASGRTRAGQDGVEKSKGRRKGGEGIAAFCSALRDANQPGHLALAEFLRAPAATQIAFWAEVRKRSEARQLESRKRAEEAAELGFSLPDFYASVLLMPIEASWREGARRIWGQRWRDRAYRDRAIEQRGRPVDDGFDAEKARLEGIEAVDYVFRLTGAEPNRAGYVHCPLPDHEERTPSFSCRETRWRCYGCQARGSIYELAGILWDLPRSGADFRRIHDRLLEVFP
jgi:hypothetical protein